MLELAQLAQVLELVTDLAQPDLVLELAILKVQAQVLAVLLRKNLLWRAIIPVYADDQIKGAWIN